MMLGDEHAEKRADGRKCASMLMGQGAKKTPPRASRGEGRRHRTRSAEPRAARGRSSQSRTRRGADQPESMQRSRTALREDQDQQEEQQHCSSTRIMRDQEEHADTEGEVQDPSFCKGLTTAVLVDSTPRRCDADMERSCGVSLSVILI